MQQLFQVFKNTRVTENRQRTGFRFREIPGWKH